MLTVSSNRGGVIYDTSYTYTLDGAVDTITYPSGRVVDYDHDFAGRPTAISVKAPGAGTFEPVASNIDYLPYGPAEHLEYGPAGTLLTEDRDFDWHYRRTHQTVVDNLSATRLDLDLGYDPAGNLTGITDTVGQRTANYDYDDLGRLTSADWSTGVQTRGYDYDDIGNLERIAVNESLSGDGEVLFGYDLNPSTNNSPVLSSVDTYEGVTLTSSHTVVTDTAGNISDDGQADYDYTLRNHLESRTLGVETSSYTFSADGRRVGMTRGGTTLDVVLGLGGRRLSRVLNGTTRDYVWLGGTLIGYFDGTATEPVRVVTSHIGFPLMAVDPAGTTVWEPMSEPYGELIGTFSKSADPGLRYPGQWQDEVEIEGSCVGDDCSMPGPLGGSVSLFENGFRWYRSAWGRYSQADPIGIRRPRNTIAHLFAYANGTPLSLADPNGLDAITDDPNMRICFFCLVDKQGWGSNPLEGAAWILDPSGGGGTGFRCATNGWIGGIGISTWPKGLGRPPHVVGQVHTHPTRSTYHRSGPEPSFGDRQTANRSDWLGWPIYTVSPEGIFKYNPNAVGAPTKKLGRDWYAHMGESTKEAGSDWWKEAKKCKPDCDKVLQ